LALEIAQGNTIIAFDTEFAGFAPSSDENSSLYEKVRQNCEQIKLLQLGITVSSPTGKIGHTWQFNFKFNVASDLQEAAAI
jgi:hypothetical protein